MRLGKATRVTGLIFIVSVLGAIFVWFGMPRQKNGGPEDVCRQKPYTNTRYAFTFCLPDTWGQFVEYDGSFNRDLTRENVRDANYLILGDEKAASEVLLTVRDDDALRQLLSSRNQAILSVRDVMTETGIAGKFIEYDARKSGYRTAYVFENGSLTIEIGVLSDGADIPTVVDSLRFEI